MASSVQIRGLDLILSTMDTLNTTLVTDVDNVCKAAALDMNAIASQYIQGDAFDTGELLSKQQFVDEGNRSYSVINTARYAAYVEFGTGAQVQVSQDWQDIANEWRNKRTAPFSEFVKRIEEWCGRHGIDPKNAYVICVSILRNGLPARPFLQPAFDKIAPELIKDIQSLINKAMRP